MTIAHEMLGSGAPTVILLHGIGGGRSIWAETAGSLADAGFTAVAVDLPGYGGSAAMAPGGVHLMAAAVLNLMDKLDLQDAVIVGHSMGGMVAQEIAASSPRRVRGLVLACTSPAFGRADGQWQANFVRERLAPLDAGLGMAGLAAQLAPAMVAANAAPAALEVSMRVMAKVPEATYRRVLAAIVAFDRRDALADIRCPTLCLAGAQDRTAPPEVHRRMAERIPEAELSVLDDAGHIANIEQPEAFAQAVIGFIRRRCSD